MGQGSGLRLGLGLGSVRVRVGVTGAVGAHFGQPAGEAQELAAFGDEKVPEVAWADLLGVEAGVRFEAPAKVGAAPWTQAVASSGRPQKARGFEHGDVYLFRDGRGGGIAWIAVPVWCR